MSAQAISVQAHVRAAHVKAAPAAGRSQNRIRETLGVAPKAAPKDAAAS